VRRRIFVFGSNLMGYHGGGAAKFARDVYGAQMGVAEGLTGECYALPTCTSPGNPMPAADVQKACERFEKFAKDHPEMDFLLTAVGCGIAGFKTHEIAAMFTTSLPENVYVQAKLAFDMDCVSGW
jgi:hypothetical protein